MSAFRQAAQSAGLLPAKTYEEYVDEPMELIELDTPVNERPGTPEQRELVRVAVELVLSDVAGMLNHDAFIAGANGHGPSLYAAARRVSNLAQSTSLIRASDFVESIVDAAISRAANPLGGGR